MTFLTVLQTLSAISGIAIIAFGTLSLKSYLKRSFCC